MTFIGEYSPEFHRQAVASLQRQVVEHGRQMQIALARQAAKRRRMPPWALEVVYELAEKHRLSPALILSKSRYRAHAICRQEAIYTVKARKPMTSLPTIGRWFDRDSTSIGYALAVYQLAHPELPAFSRHTVELLPRTIEEKGRRRAA